MEEYSRNDLPFNEPTIVNEPSYVEIPKEVVKTSKERKKDKAKNKTNRGVQSILVYQRASDLMRALLELKFKAPKKMLHEFDILETNVNNLLIAICFADEQPKDLPRRIDYLGEALSFVNATLTIFKDLSIVACIEKDSRNKILKHINSISSQLINWRQYTLGLVSKQVSNLVG